MDEFCFSCFVLRLVKTHISGAIVIKECFVSAMKFGSFEHDLLFLHKVSSIRLLTELGRWFKKCYT